jgi:hypothetical protein
MNSTYRNEISHIKSFSEMLLCLQEVIISDVIQLVPVIQVRGVVRHPDVNANKRQIFQRHCR